MMSSGFAIALSAFGLAPVWAAQLVDSETIYWEAVAQYASGDRATALKDIGSFGAKDLDEVADAVEKLARAAKKCEDCEARRQFDALPLRAAVLLHAQRDRADRAFRMKQTNGTPDCLVSAQGTAAERLLGFVDPQRGGTAFVASFSLAIALDSRSMLCYLRASHWAEVGLKAAPENAALLTARGLAAETMGVTGWAEPTPVMIYDNLSRNDPRRGGRTVMRSTPVDKTRLLNVARESFEKAIALDPNQEEARVRLGRVLWRLGRMKEARERLVKAVELGKENVTTYLAHLFLGKCLEDSQDLNGAIEEYKIAVSLRPELQMGAVALAHALTLRGDAEGARQVLEPALAYSGNRRAEDPYWWYLVGSPDLSDALLESLRLELTR